MNRSPLAGLPALRLVSPLAALALAALLVGRMAAPAAVGIAIGAGKLVRALEVTGGALSQLFAVAAIVVAMALLGAFARSGAPFVLRAFAILAAGFVILIVLHATVQRVPDLSSVLIAGVAALLALGAVWDARRAPFARPVAVTLGLVGLGVLVRFAGVVLALRAGAGPRPELASLARGFATAGFVIDGLAVLMGVIALAARSKRADGGPSPVARPVTILALLVAFLATRQALLGGGEDASAFDVFLRRAFDRLLVRPAPLVPLSVQIFVAALSLVTALSALLVQGVGSGRWGSRAADPRSAPLPTALSGALALMLIARSAPDAPLGALSLVIAAFSVALAARDDRGLWAAIIANGSGREEVPPPSPRARVPSGVRQVDAEDDNH